ncbi:hypothetical protein BRARA_B02428 [Brassica rapa]|uniref:Uncharacterized protein n=1 Tax=Brassica campestris TaxID=3711 RepID=A0A398ABZ0_BRACM|nr:hypothetical protein BRARA_B02428 [Brassica rapa]
METDAVLELAEEFQNLTDGEGKDMGQVEATEAAAAKKKTGLRKPLFSVAGGSNSKFVQVLMSPRKGGGARPVEEKGPSYPSYLNLKILCYGDGRVFLVLFFLLFQ